MATHDTSGPVTAADAAKAALTSSGESSKRQSDDYEKIEIGEWVRKIYASFPNSRSIEPALLRSATRLIAERGLSDDDRRSVARQVVMKFKFPPSVAELLSVVDEIKPPPHEKSETERARNADIELFHRARLTVAEWNELRANGYGQDAIREFCEARIADPALAIASHKTERTLSVETQAKLDEFHAHVQAQETAENEEQNRNRRARLKSTQCERGAAIAKSQLLRDYQIMHRDQEVTSQHDEREAAIRARDGGQ